MKQTIAAVFGALCLLAVSAAGQVAHAQYPYHRHHYYRHWHHRHYHHYHRRPIIRIVP